MKSFLIKFAKSIGILIAYPLLLVVVLLFTALALVLGAVVGVIGVVCATLVVIADVLTLGQFELSELVIDAVN